MMVTVVLLTLVVAIMANMDTLGALIINYTNLGGSLF